MEAELDQEVRNLKFSVRIIYFIFLFIHFKGPRGPGGEEVVVVLCFELNFNIFQIEIINKKDQQDHRVINQNPFIIKFFHDFQNNLKDLKDPKAHPDLQDPQVITNLFAN